MFIGRKGYIASFLRSKFREKYLFTSEKLGSKKLHYQRRLQMVYLETYIIYNLPPCNSKCNIEAKARWPSN